MGAVPVVAIVFSGFGSDSASKSSRPSFPKRTNSSLRQFRKSAGVVLRRTRATLSKRPFDSKLWGIGKRCRSLNQRVRGRKAGLNDKALVFFLARAKRLGGDRTH